MLRPDPALHTFPPSGPGTRGAARLEKNPAQAGLWAQAGLSDFPYSSNPRGSHHRLGGLGDGGAEKVGEEQVDLIQHPSKGTARPQTKWGSTPGEHQARGQMLCPSYKEIDPSGFCRGYIDELDGDIIQTTPIFLRFLRVVLILDIPPEMLFCFPFSILVRGEGSVKFRGFLLAFLTMLALTPQASNPL